MLKKFVPLNSPTSPTKNPYEVRTYMGDPGKQDWKVDPPCKIERKCDQQNSTISQVITIEDEIRRLNQKAKESRFMRPYKKKCALYDDYTVCIATQRTPQELKTHAVMREHYLATKYEYGQFVHDGRTWPDLEPGVVQLPDAAELVGEEEIAPEEEEGEDEEGEKDKTIRPKPASPTCSDQAIFLPPSKLLELKRPKSGFFHNETPAPICDEDGIPYSRYNPRILQEQFDEQGLRKIDLIEGKMPNDIWTWNIGLQRNESELDHAYIQASIPKMECNNWDLTAFKIPKDLDKTFTAEIVFGNKKVVPDPKPRKPPFYNRPREVACAMVAYVESFHLNPDFWTASTMDGIIKIAEGLLKKSNTLNYKSYQTDIDIISHIEEREAVVNMKLHYTGILNNEPNVYKTLSLYFSKYNAAIFVTHNLRFLILKRCQNSYFVFDPNGRNDQCQRDFERGNCSLMKMQFVEHLVHLIVNFSQANMEDEFSLYEVFLLNFGKIDEPWPDAQMRCLRRRWAVVNDAYAVIPSYKEGLSPPFSANENNASMVCSLFALIYADIERAMDWRMETIDDLIRFGMVFNRHLRLKYRLRNPTQQLNILDMPTAVLMVAYRCFLKKFPFLYSGHVAECRSFLDSQLTSSLKELFSGQWEAALLQIDNSVLAVWRDTEVFYVFDPFRRGNAGQVLDPDDYRARGAAILQLHANFESFCRIIYQKALKMRRGGKFFLHGINVGCIKPKRECSEPNKYPKLKLLPPVFGEENDKDPCQPKKNEPDIYELKEEERIPEFDEDDVIDTVLDDIVSELLNSIREPPLGRPPLYKQAKRILLRSDKDYLRSLKHKLLHHGDYDNMFTAFQTTPDQTTPIMTMEEELAIPSNFKLLPDGTWVIFGTRELPEQEDELSKLSGLLSGLTTLVMASKFKISTWAPSLIDYALDSGEFYGEDYKDYQTALIGLLSKRVPKVALGESEIYETTVEKIIKSASTRPLRQVLLETLISHSRLLVICQRFSCVIVKRYNFLYMYIGYPCNAAGYRKFGPGRGCILRLVELDSLIRRIEFGCNPAGCDITHYVVLALKVRNPALPKFRRWPKDVQDEMVQKEEERQRKLREMRSTKMRFLDDSLRKEHDRIKKFFAEKNKGSELGRRQSKSKRRKRFYYGEDGEMAMEEDMEDIEEEDMEEEGEEEEEIELKHKPGRRLRKELTHEFKPRAVLYGYHMRVKDCLFKIQGSIALEGRETAIGEEIKPCFFASTYAILYAVLRPLNEWHSQRIDQVIQGALALSDKVKDMEMSLERTITNITVDEYRFDVWVRSFEPAGALSGTAKRQILKASQMSKYMLLFTYNTTYAIYRDEFYHLFDPYGSMNKVGMGAEEEEAEETHKKHCPRGIKRYGERNTASWVLFLDIDQLLKYVSDRNSNPGWKEAFEFRFYTVDVISHRKAPPNERILRLLTDFSIPRTCDTSQYGKSEFDVCATMESLSWLDLENCLPVWSRLNRRNTSGRYRNLPVSKFKKFDIEIDGRLWSLWGNLHPEAPVFDEISRGRQYLACYVIACCATRIYHLMDWSPHLLDTIIINGDRYHRESLANIKRNDYEFSLEDLGCDCMLENIKFLVNIQHVAYGRLYIEAKYGRMNLSEALVYFFSYFSLGILQCHNRSLAIGLLPGHNGGYFMYDCQSREHPLFPKGQGASYMLRTRHLQVLLYCIVVTLNVPYYNVEFTLHKVELLSEGGTLEEMGEEGENEEADQD